MLSRYDRNNVPAKKLPQKWTDKFKKALAEQYESDLTHTHKKFELFTELYSNEVCLGLCLISNKNDTERATTYLVSAELSDKTDPMDILDHMVDSAEVFFDQYFANEDEVEYSTVWEEGEINKLKFHYKITRENLELTQKANDLLGDDFPV